MGEVIDLSKKLLLSRLADALMSDLGIPKDVIEENGGSVAVARKFKESLDMIPYEAVETIEDDHPELFKLLRGDG